MNILKINVETIGILMIEKRNLTSKLNQSLKQLEKKQFEIDEFQGRLKASRDKIQELEKQISQMDSIIKRKTFVCFFS